MGAKVFDSPWLHFLNPKSISIPVSVDGSVAPRHKNNHAKDRASISTKCSNRRARLSGSGSVSYLLGSYRIATAPDPNSRRLTSLKFTCFDSPASNVGPWPASMGCTTNS